MLHLPCPLLAICRYALPELAWLGARTEQLMEVEDEVWQALTQRDHALISTLKAGPLQVASKPSLRS